MEEPRAQRAYPGAFVTHSSDGQMRSRERRISEAHCPLHLACAAEKPTETLFQSRKCELMPEWFSNSHIHAVHTAHTYTHTYMASSHNTHICAHRERDYTYTKYPYIIHTHMCTQTHTVHTHTAITVVWFRLEGSKKLSCIECESRQEHLPGMGGREHGTRMSPGSSLGHSLGRRKG